MTDIANLEAERSVIGALVSDPRVQDQAGRLSVEDFSDAHYRRAFREIQSLQAERIPVDLVTLGDRLSNATETVMAVVEAMRLTTLTFNCSSYVDLVLDASVRRNVSRISEQLYRDMCNRDLDALESIATARAKLADVGVSGPDEWMSATEIALKTITDIENRMHGKMNPVQSGLSDLDYLTGGFFPGELTIVGAKPGVGKSVFGMMVALNAAQAGAHSGVCSLEMMDTQYGQRMLSNMSGVNGMKLRKAAGLNEDDWKLLIGAVTRLSKIPSAFTFATRYVEDLALAVRRRVDAGELSILVVDYLQLMRTRQKTENERLSIAAISWALKTLATECRIPVIALAQLRRPGQGEANKMPTMRDLRESGNLEADADNIILLHEPESKDDPYVHRDDKQGFDEMRKRGDRYIALKVEKQRQGSTGALSVIFKPQEMRYVQIKR